MVYVRFWGMKRELKIMTIIKCIYWRLLGFLSCWGQVCGSSEQSVKLLHVGFCPVVHFKHNLTHTQTLSYWKPSHPVKLGSIEHSPFCTSEPNMTIEGVADANFKQTERPTQLQTQVTIHFRNELTILICAGALLTPAAFPPPLFKIRSDAKHLEQLP